MASPPRHDRQRRGQQPAEHPDQHQEAERNRQRLHQQQVALVLTVDLVVHHRCSAGAHRDAVAVMHDSGRDLLGVVLRVVLAALEVRHDQPGLAVLADQACGQMRRVRPGPCGDDVVHPVRGLDLAGDVGGDAAGLSALRAARRGHQDDQLLVALPELVGQQLDRVRRLRGRVLKTTGGQTLGDRKPEYRGSHQDQHRSCEYAPRALRWQGGRSAAA